MFHALNQQHIRQIVGILLESLKKRCREQLEIDIKVTGAAKDLLAEAGFDSKYGARPLRRAIQTKVEDRLANEILEGHIKRGDTVQVQAAKKELIFSVK